MTRRIPLPAGKCPQARGHLQSGCPLASTPLNVNNYPVEIINGQAFVVIVSEESAP
jgi:hypothetical protein